MFQILHKGKHPYLVNFLYSISVLLFNDNTIIAKKDTLLQLVTLKIVCSKKIQKDEKIRIDTQDTVAASPSVVQTVDLITFLRKKSKKDAVITSKGTETF